ncbi:MAG: toxin-antitoxin system YwqK family antitoxin [Bacteroidia bacterium]|nr:toxin-antitoxin system YwqK family antitoxin [Bacteroidia bacterium]
MKTSLLTGFFAVCLAAFAGDQNGTNYTDPATGWKQGHWVYTNEVKKLPNFPPTAKVEEGDYKDNRKTGIWVSYFPNGNKKSEITFDNNRAKGYAKVYYEDGKVMEEGNWENNRWTGDYKYFHPNGQLSYEFKYNNAGKREGKQTYYHENGEVLMSGEMKDGKEAGVWEEHYENGDLKSKKSFNDGAIDPTKTETFMPQTQIVDNTPDTPKDAPPAPKVDPKKDAPNRADLKIFDGNGYYKLYNLNKQLSKDGTFKNYKLINGKDYVYSKDGILVQIAVYKDGLYVGDAPIEEK